MQTGVRTQAAQVRNKPQRSKPTSERGESWNDSTASMLLSTANFWRRSGNAYYRELFGISITEVAILTLLSRRAPLTLNAIADHCGIDKTQMSREVKDLVERKLVRQRKSARHGSELEISLDKEGQRLCERLKPATAARFATLLASLTPRQVAQFESLLGKLLGNARAMARGEKPQKL
jgi:DNA-binding MarR family transcriptional regulator